ncbi:MAG: heavy metal-associated domain-containing protein [Bacteroidia bacterium]|nr:heavy-metal-associated domain-containing protein [Bacteroidia bacterium]MDW8159494.1 heavy metal-associated domain-containing protein [Bacteroidia bacterium]
MKILLKYILQLLIFMGFASIAPLGVITKAVTKTIEQTKRLTIAVRSSVQCKMCVQTIEKRLLEEAGVEKVSVDLKKRIIRVEYDPEQTDSEKIKLAIARLGYDADDFPANIQAYNALPFCCKKP